MWHAAVGQGHFGQDPFWAQLAYARRVAAFQTAVPRYVHPSWGTAHAGLLAPWQTPVVAGDWDAASEQSFFFHSGSPPLFFATLPPPLFATVCQQVFLLICRADANLMVSGKKLRVLSGFFPPSVMEGFVASEPLNTKAFLGSNPFVLPLPDVFTEQDLLGFVYGFLYGWWADDLPVAFVHRLSLRFPKQGVQSLYYKNVFSLWPTATTEELVDNILLHVCRDYALVRG